MDVDAVLTAGTRERLFADWGASVVFRSVTQTYDAETGKVSESFADTAVTAVQSPRAGESTRDAAGQHAREEVVFLIREEDAPAGAPLATSRIVAGGDEFRIVSSERSEATGTVAVRCRRM